MSFHSFRSVVVNTVKQTEQRKLVSTGEHEPKVLNPVPHCGKENWDNLSLGVGKGSKSPGPLGFSGQAEEFWLLEKIHRHLHLLLASAQQRQSERRQISKWACICTDSEY